MRIKALVIGCEDLQGEYLEGVSVDIHSMYNYLLSNTGGGWLKSEIIKLETDNKSEVMSLIEDTRSEYNDFVLVYFAGHGSFNSIEGRKFYTNTINDEDYITQDDIGDLSDKQVCIFDTCANDERILVEKFEHGIESRVFDSINNPYREQYLRSIMECSDQTIDLYACAEDEGSGESDRGGYYTQSLLDSAYKSTIDLTVLDAHRLAVPLVIRSSRDKQHPSYDVIPRSGKKLPFSVT